MTNNQSEDIAAIAAGLSEGDEIWRIIQVLTADEGNSVDVLCGNADFNGLPNWAIECNGDWTDWITVRFAHDIRIECFRLALRAHLNKTDGEKR